VLYEVNDNAPKADRNDDARVTGRDAENRAAVFVFSTFQASVKPKASWRS